MRECDRRGFLPDRFLKICAVLSGGMTALLPTPGTGVCKPGMAYRRDTNRRRRQVTKLPIPVPQYLPFTLRYGCLRCIPRLRRCHAPGSHAGIARAFDVIGLTGRGRGFHPLSLSLAAGSRGVEWLMQDAVTYILSMSRSLSCCFSRFNRYSGSKLTENTVNRGEVVPGKLCA